MLRLVVHAAADVLWLAVLLPCGVFFFFVVVVVFPLFFLVAASFR
jgi:hypothetical protein